MECHSRTGGPAFLVAGTVYPPESGQADNDCYGVANATVVIEGADGTSINLETNEAGNFYLRKRDGPIEFPLTVRVEAAGEIREMSVPAESGSCNSCHTPEGSNGAPGRVLTP